mmetsp:Transcript_17579/g.49683  ORF Transcript_17579/g.49683 Transcript_17579/m.49683 type:complete len:224 (+) Transcript_17579:1093-1764(+)
MRNGVRPLRDLVARHAPVVLLDVRGAEVHAAHKRCWGRGQLVVRAGRGIGVLLPGSLRLHVQNDDLLLRIHLLRSVGAFHDPAAAGGRAPRPTRTRSEASRKRRIASRRFHLVLPAGVHHSAVAAPRPIRQQMGIRVRGNLRIRLFDGRVEGVSTLPGAGMVCHPERRASVSGIADRNPANLCQHGTDIMHHVHRTSRLAGRVRRSKFLCCRHIPSSQGCSRQ